MSEKRGRGRPRIMSSEEFFDLVYPCLLRGASVREIAARAGVSKSTASTLLTSIGVVREGLWRLQEEGVTHETQSSEQPTIRRAIPRPG